MGQLHEKSVRGLSKRAKEREACEKEQIAPVALLSCATWANCSRPLFKMKNIEQKSEWAKEQIPNPAI